MADDVLSIRLEAILSEFKAQLVEATGIMQQSRSTMENGFKEVSKAATNAGKQASDSFKKTGADITSSFKDMQAQVVGAIGGVTTGIGGWLTSLGTIKIAVVELLAVFAGLAAMLISSAKDMDEWTRESLKLARGFGITSEEASVLKVAMEELAAKNLTGDVSVQTLLRAYTMFIQKLRDNKEELEKWGITWQGTGFKTFMSATEAYQKLDSAAEKAAMRTDLFGARVGLQLSPILSNLSEKVLKDAIGKTEELGRVVGVEAVTASLGLSMSTLKLHEAWQTLHSHLAVVAIPLWGLTKEILAGILAVINKVIGGVSGLFTATANFVATAGKPFADMIDNIAKKLGALATSAASAEQGIYDLQAAALPGALPPTPSPKADEPGAPPTPKTGKGGGESIVAKWRAELEEIKLLSEKLLESTLADDKKYWEEKLELCKEGSKEYKEVQHQVLTLTKQIARQEYQERLADLKAQMAEETKNSREKIALQDIALKDALKASGKESAQYQNLLKEKNAMLRQAELEARQLRISAMEHQQSLYKIEAEMAREYLRFQREMGLMNESQVIQGLKRIEMAEFQSERNKLARERAEYKESEKEFQTYTQKIEELDKKHNANMQKLDNQYTLAVKHQWDQIVAAISSAFSNAIQGLIAGTMTFKQAMVSIFQSIFNALINMLTKWVFEWIASLLYSAIFGRITAVQRVVQESGVAFAAAYASTCAIPIIGPLLAPGVAAAAQAAAMMGGLPFASAEGGWDIPRDSLAMVHGGEMVLPAELADRIRGMSEPSSGRTLTVHNHFDVKAWDSADVKRFFRRHGSKLVDTLVEQARNANPAASRVRNK